MKKDITKNHKKQKVQGQTSLRTGSYIVLAILIVAFIGAPIISIGIQRNISNFIFGKYGNTEIRYEQDSYFGQNVQSQIQTLEQQVGQNGLNSSFLRYAWKNAFDRAVLHYALLDMAKKARYYISKDALNKSLIELPFLQKNGKFDVAIYNSLSDKQKQSITQNQADTETTLSVYEDITSLISVSDKEVQFFKEIDSQTRSFKFARIEKNKIEDTNLLINYGKENEQEFISYDLESITLASKKEAEEVLQKITNEELTFEEAAKTYSTDSAKEQDGKRGELFAYQISQQEGDDALKAIKELKETTDISPITKTLQGSFALYKITKQAITPNFESEKIQTTIKNYLLANDPSIVIDHNKNILKKITNSTQTSNFETSAKNLELETGTTNNFPININNVSALTKIETQNEGVDISELSSEEDILANLFSLKENEFSEPKVVGNYVYLFLVNSINSASNNSISTITKDSLLSFEKQVREATVRTAVVNEDKLTDNFNNAFQTIYPPSNN